MTTLYKLLGEAEPTVRCPNCRENTGSGYEIGNSELTRKNSETEISESGNSELRDKFMELIKDLEDAVEIRYSGYEWGVSRTTRGIKEAEEALLAAIEEVRG